MPGASSIGPGASSRTDADRLRPRRRPRRRSGRAIGRVVASGPPGSTGSSMRGRRDDDDVGALADRQPAAVGLARRDAPGRRRPPRSARSSVSASSGANGGVPAGQRASSRRTASASPGHGSNGSTGASVPNAMTAPVVGDAPPRVAVAPRRGRPTAGGPGRRRCRGGPAGRRRDPGRGEPGAIVGMEHLDVLDPGHERLAGGAGRQDVQGDPDRRVADGVDLRRDPAGRGPRDPLAQAVAVGHPDAAPALGRRAAGRARARCPRAAPPSATRATRRRSTSASRPAPSPSGSAPRIVAAAEAARRCAVATRVVAHARRGRGAAGRPRRRGARRPGSPRSRSGSGASRPGRGRRRRRARASSRPTATIGRCEVVRRRRRDVDRDEPGRRLVQDALGRPVARRGGRRRRAGRPSPNPPGAIARVAGPQGVVVVGPEATRARARRARGRRRSASRPSGRCPSRGPRSQAPGSRGATWAARMRARPVGQRRGGRSGPPGGSRSARLGEVQVRVGQARDARPRPARGGSAAVNGSARVSRSTSEPGEGDPPVADADGLDPAEAAVAGEGRDPTGDERVEGHGRSGVAGRRGAPPARRGPGRRRARAPARPAP